MNRFSIVLLTLAACIVSGQEFRGTLNGRITDAQGATIIGSRIIATQAETGAKSETVSGEDGLYTVPFLSPGNYTVTAESSGFKKYVRKGISITTNARATLDIQLEVGAITDSVTVR